MAVTPTKSYYRGSEENGGEEAAKDSLVAKEIRVNQDHLDLLDLQARMVLKDYEEPRGKLASQESLEKMGSGDSQVNVVLLEKVDHPERQGNLE